MPSDTHHEFLESVDAETRARLFFEMGLVDHPEYRDLQNRTANFNGGPYQQRLAAVGTSAEEDEKQSSSIQLAYV